MMLLFKGVLISVAGPAPNYDMQRVLSAKNPREACMMSGWVNVVLTLPRYFLITGLPFWRSFSSATDWGHGHQHGLRVGASHALGDSCLPDCWDS